MDDNGEYNNNIMIVFYYPVYSVVPQCMCVQCVPGSFSPS